ncbi:MAG TPA: HAMP domain-containing sensor histidine kinase [Anaeromyxobacteraceae bacterium]
MLLAILGLVVTALSAKPLAGPFFMFQFAAVVGAALYGGLGPGLLTMVLSGVGFFAVFFAPALEGYEAYRLGSFLLVSMFFAVLAARMRDAKHAAEEARVRAEAAEAEARTIGAQQERLVAIVSHDLRNPLNAITVSAQSLQLDASERQAKGLSRIVTSARRMQSMIHDLLDFARARHGSGLPVQPQPARLGDICRSAIEEVRTAKPTRTVLLDVTGDDTAALDALRVEQVVSNLVTNALMHGAADAPVEVSVAEDGAAVRLEVTNRGAPIPPHLVPALFDPFRSGDAPGSVGLGLFIVSEIARAHGGSVSVRSGEAGTTFAVVFPKCSTEVVSATAAA